MKIIFVTREGYALAGGRIRAYSFAKELAERGINAEVLSYTEHLGAKDGAHEGSMGLPEKIRHNITAYKILSKEKGAIIVLQRVNYHSFAPLLSRVLKRNRLVLDLDDWEMRENPRYLFGFYPTSKAEYLTRRIARLADFCIVGSRYLKDYISEFNRKVYYIPTCVDTERFCPAVTGNKRRGVRFTWTGTLHRKEDVRNVIFAIDCFERVRAGSTPISLDIVGDGIYRQDVMRYISKHMGEHKIHFVDWIYPHKVPEYLRDIDIGLFPLVGESRFNVSKSPTKLFEYMAMEKATVSSSIGEAKDIVTDGKNGFLAEDKRTFIDRMERLVRDKKLRDEMGREARKRAARNYSLKGAGEKLFTAFKDMYGENL